MNKLDKDAIIGSNEIWKRKKFVRYKDGAELYSLSKNQFRKLAEEAQAIYRWGDKVVLINTQIIDKYLEFFHVTDEC